MNGVKSKFVALAEIQESLAKIEKMIGENQGYEQAALSRIILSLPVYSASPTMPTRLRLFTWAVFNPISFALGGLPGWWVFRQPQKEKDNGIK